MKGKYRVRIQNKKVQYNFEIRRNLTIIQGNSATGKTTLVDMVREYDENGASSGITLNCEKECVVLEGRRWKADLHEITESLVFIDEGNDFVMSEEFASEIQKTDNYYIIVTREALPMLPYSVEEIYGIRNAGKYGRLKQTYNEFFHIYRSGTSINEEIIPEYVIVEDSNSGFEFFQTVCGDAGIVCVSSNGKSGMINALPKQNNQAVLLIADGAAFGSEMEKISQVMLDYKNIVLYAPESFEWLILQSGLFHGQEIKQVLEEPEKYIESQIYFSWEQFFTSFLIKTTQGTYLQYQKRKLNPAYLQEQIRNKIVGSIEGICFGEVE